ncbi:unnamed protein product [Cladocopium goreaui]|uniref:Uncharacterized protein n=1 Tax=Cladocopium goreaui TaxID=2562237 RepID=A0A9P1M5E4_9DINO|nr:unnamed protein product [Cladocopium goreaui]
MSHKSVRMPACIFQNGQAAAFIGKDGRLYTMHRDTADPLEVPTAPIAKSIGKNIAIIA